MNKDEAIRMAKAMLECLERNTSGLFEKCNNDCENCNLNYDQGNMGEQKEWLRFVIKALEQEPVYFPPCIDCNTKMNEIREAYDKRKNQEPCEDAVSRQATLGALNCEISGRIESDIDLCKYKREFQEFADMILKSQEKAIQALPSVTPTSEASEWQQDHAILKAHADGANEVIDRVKQAREEIKDMQSHIQLKDKTTNEHWIFVDKFEVLAILDKLIAEVEG